MRSSRVRPLAAVAAAAVALVVLEERKDGPNIAMFVTLATVVLAAAAAYAVEDDAGIILASSPTTLLRRRASHLLVAAGVAFAGWLVLAAVALLGSDASPATAHNGLLAAASGGIGLGVGAWGERRGMDQAGMFGTVTAVSMVLAVTSASFKYRWLPSMTDPANDGKWLLLAASGLAMALWMSRDPAFRGRRRGRELLLST